MSAPGTPARSIWFGRLRLALVAGAALGAGWQVTHWDAPPAATQPSSAAENSPAKPAVATAPKMVPKRVESRRRESAGDGAQRVAATPPVAAASVPASVLSDNTDWAARRQACLQTALRMAQTAPLEALRWAAKQPEEISGPAVIATASEAARENPVASLNALAELIPSAERDAAIIHAAAQWGLLEPAAAAAWASGLPANELRERACTAVALALAERDPRGAADFVATQMAEGVPLRTATVGVVQRWAQRDPAAATHWVSQFPAGPLRDDAEREIQVQQTASRGER